LWKSVAFFKASKAYLNRSYIFLASLNAKLGGSGAILEACSKKYYELS
jgi:hypothetical protein